MAQEAPRRPQDSPEWTQDGPQDGPRRPQDGPKRPPRRAKTAPRPPKKSPERPKTAPGRPQDAPKTALRRPQDASKTPQDALKIFFGAPKRGLCCVRVPSRSWGPTWASKSLNLGPKRAPQMTQLELQKGPKKLSKRISNRSQRHQLTANLGSKNMYLGNERAPEMI